MKRETAEKWMLLEQSGELDPVRRWLLRRRLAARPDEKQYRIEIETMLNAARATDEECLVPRDVEACILNEAEHAAQVKEGLVFRLSLQTVSVWRPAIALAGLLALIAAGVMLTRMPESHTQIAGTAPAAEPAQTMPDDPTAPGWEDSFDAELAELGSLIASSSAWDDTGANGSDLDSIARQLLEFEGAEI